MPKGTFASWLEVKIHLTCRLNESMYCKTYSSISIVILSSGRSKQAIEFYGNYGALNIRLGIERLNSQHDIEINKNRIGCRTTYSK